jgi:hypothetical protein
MLDPGAELHGLVFERLAPAGEEFLQGWPDNGESVSSGVFPVLEIHHEGRDPHETPSDRKEPLVLHLITDRTGILGQKWVFHQYDDDFFPSVPHGHLQSKSGVKLDAYRGYTYDTRQGNASLTRERRDFIVGLWKDPKFRVLARRALDYFTERYPFFNWWNQRRILHPSRLPR